jgi:hypothetical protein
MSEFCINIIDNEYNINYHDDKEIEIMKILLSINIYEKFIFIVIDNMDLSRLPEIKDENNREILLRLSNLDNLEIIDGFKLNIKNISELIIENCSNLKIIKNISNIETFQIYNCYNLKNITNISSINQLDIKGCDKIEDINNISKMNRLLIHSCDVSNINNINEITELSFEDCLDINNISNISNIDCIYVEHTYISIIENIRKVRILHISDMTDQYIRFNESIEEELSCIMKIFLITNMYNSNIEMNIDYDNYSMIKNISDDIELLVV